MSVVRGTLIQEVDGKTQYVYPKTTVDMVEYKNSTSVKDKIEDIEKNISEANARITNIASGIDYGSISTKNDAELINIRVPNYNIAPADIKFDSAGDAIRWQFNELFLLIQNIQNEIDILKKSIK